jgi:hypothetical protein
MSICVPCIVSFLNSLINLKILIPIRVDIYLEFLLLCIELLVNSETGKVANLPILAFVQTTYFLCY